MKKVTAYVLCLVVLVSATITIAALAQTDVAVATGSAPTSMMSTPF